MKKLFACLLFLLLAIPGRAEAASTIMDQARRTSLPESRAVAYRYIDNFMERYYLGKPYYRIADFLYILNQTRMLEDYPHTAQPVTAFMSVVFADNPGHALEWIVPPQSKQRKKALIQPVARYSNEMTKMLQYAVWLSGRSGEENMAQLYEQKPDYLSKHPVPLAEMPVQKEEDINTLWGAFIASGEGKYIGRIIDTACDGSKSSLQKAAAQSLGENVKAHEKAARTLRARVADHPCDNIKNLVPKPLNLGQMDGEFSASLLLADYKASTKLMGGPIEAVTQLPALDKIQPNGKISVIFVFSGMAMREDLETNVDFDFILIGPNGKPVEKSNISKRKISPTKRSGRYITYHPNAFLSLFFKEEYPAGTYTVKITLRDNIGNKKIDLQKSIEFVKPAP